MTKVATGCFTIIGVVIALIAVVGGGVWYFATTPRPFDETIRIPLPPEIGGTLAMNVRGEFLLKPAELAATTSVALQLTQAQLNEALPTAEYSILVQETNNPNIASMLGRLAFVPGSADISIEGRNIKIRADVIGELFVRERRDYQTDEEQPDAGTPQPMAAIVEFVATDISLTPQWSLGDTDMNVSVSLAGIVRDAWRDKYGTGDEFANLVEGILNDRAASFVARLDVTTTDMRTPLHELIARMDKEFRNENSGDSLNFYRMDRIEVDNCPTQDPAGSISLNLAAVASIDPESTQLPALPDMIVRSGPC